jgi:histidinol-phosphate/aromatic aminotransferase/cobyric acid decarboxylase-like protein
VVMGAMLFPSEMGSTVDARSLGKIFRINGLRAGAEAQINPTLTSTVAQISISYAAPASL